MGLTEAMEILWSGVALALGLPALAATSVAAAVAQPSLSLEAVPSRSIVHINGVEFISQAAENEYAITRPASNVLRFEVRAGDTYEGPFRRDRGVHRAEMSQHGPGFRYGDDTWISFSQRIVQLYPIAEKQWVILGQLHGPNKNNLPEDTDLGPPPFSIGYRADKGFIFATRFGTEERGQIEKQTHYAGQPEIGEWVDYVIHIRTGDSDAGLLSVWKNGEQIIDYQGPVGYRAGRGRHYWKFGLYESATDDTTRIVEYANMHVGSESLSEKIDSPDPIPDL